MTAAVSTATPQIDVDDDPFDYLLQKLIDTPFEAEPFKHLYIENFLSEEHFRRFVTAPQIALDAAGSTEELLDLMEQQGYETIQFPGCVTSRKAYLDWFHGRSSKQWHAATEGFGMVYRLNAFRDGLLSGLDAFFHSERLKAVLIEKFGIERPVEVDAGVQKYLHGYEISPHPDIRRKALTWMLNVNPGENTEEEEFHTYYLRLKDQWKFIADFWEHNPGVERDWLPWDWCETAKRQRKNNSIVIFSPSNTTIHAVKAEYDHLRTQRTQVYGNLWYDLVRLPKLDYHHFDLGRHAAIPVPAGRKLLDNPVAAALKDTALGRQVKSLKATLTGKAKEASIRKVDF